MLIYTDFIYTNMEISLVSFKTVKPLLSLPVDDQEETLILEAEVIVLESSGQGNEARWSV